MPLDKQIVPISFKSGLNQKPDPKQLVPGELTVLENVVFDVGMQFTKRNGYENLSTNISGGGTISSGSAVAAFQKELITFDGIDLYSYDESRTQQVLKGQCESAYITDFAVVRNGTAQTVPDSAIGTMGYECFCWEDGSGEVRFTILDSATNQAVVNNKSTVTNSFAPRVLAYNGYFLLFYVVATTLYMVSIPENDPTNTSLYTIASSLDTPNQICYDCAAINGYVYVGYATTTPSHQVGTLRINPSLIIDRTSSLYSYIAAANTIAVFGNASHVFWATNSDAGINLTETSTDLTPTANTIIADVVPFATIVGVMTGTNTYQLFYTVPVDISNKRPQVFTSTGSKPTVLRGSVSVASKPIFIDGSVYLMVIQLSQYQPTYFLIDGQGYIAGKVFYANAGSAPQDITFTIAGGNAGAVSDRYWLLPQMNLLDTLTIQFAALQKESLTVVSGVQYAPTGVNSVIMNLSDAQTNFSTVTLGQNLMIGGGFPQMYDGANVVEHNFHLFPEGGSFLTAPLGGALAKGDYQYQTTFEWTDNQGQIHRSAPSIPIAPSNQVNNPATTADISNTLGTYVFNALVTDGGFNVQNDPSFPSNMRIDLLFPGCLIQDSAEAVPNGSYINYILYNDGLGGSSAFLNNSATSTAQSDTITCTYGLNRQGTVTAGSPNIILASIPILYAFGQIAAGSSVIQMVSVEGIVAGMYLGASLYFSGTVDTFLGNPTIIAVDPVARTVSISATAVSSSPGLSAVSFAWQFFASGTVGSVINGVDAATVAFANTMIGAEIFTTISAVPTDLGVHIVSATGTSITCSDSIAFGSQYFIGFPGTTQIKQGQVVAGSALPAFSFEGQYTSGTDTILSCTAPAVAYANAHLNVSIISQGLADDGAVVLSASGTTIIMSRNAIGDGTSGSGGFPASTMGVPTQSPVAGTPIITAVSVIGGVGTITLDSPAQGGYPNSTIASLAALQISNTFIVQATIPTLRMTAKQDPSYPISLVTYRSIVDATDVFYEVSRITDPAFTATDSETFVDALSDVQLAGGPGVLNSATQLYTTGGVLEDGAGPPCTSLTTYVNRLVLIDSTNLQTIWYSKQVVPGTPVEFNQSQTLNIDPRGGNCTALINMDDKLIIFKENSIFFLTGNGPNSLGQQNDFTDTQLVTTDCGCIDPKSVVLMPLGIMFKSSKGIYLLNRSLQAQYVGANVEGFNQYTVSSAQLIPSTNQVRFTLNGTPKALIYDYFYGLWGTFTNIAAVGSCLFDGLFNWIDTTGIVHQETPGVFTDNGSFITLHFTTGWMSFAGLQGFQRVYKLLLLGEYISPHLLQVQIAYDFNPEYQQTIAIDPSVLLSEPFGDDPWFGSTDVFGGPYPVYQLRLFTIRQKTQSILLDVQDNPSSPIGEGAAFSAFAFEVGLKKGVYRMPAYKSVG